MLSPSTHWFPGRNQLVRNLEAVGEISEPDVVVYCSVCESAVPELPIESYPTRATSLVRRRSESVRSRYLGETDGELFATR